MAADLSRTVLNGLPLLNLRIDAQHIDVAQLEAMIPKSQASTSPVRDARPGTAALDIPLLPQDIDLNTGPDCGYHVVQVIAFRFLGEIPKRLLPISSSSSD